MNTRVVYFQGFGLALTDDYAGGMMTRDEDGNGVGQPEEGWEVREGSQCDPEEFTRFIDQQ